MHSEPKYIYVKSSAEFHANIVYFNSSVFWNEVLDQKCNATGWVEIKIAAYNHRAIDKVRKLKGGWYENKKNNIK